MRKQFRTILLSIFILTFILYVFNEISTDSSMQVVSSYKNLRIDPLLQPSSSNRTSEQGCILIYNRVPKAGSTSLLALLDRIGNENNFTIETSTIFREPKINYEEREELVKVWLNKFYEIGTFSYNRHLHFIDISSMEILTANERSLFIWMNFVREPVGQYISSFYYNRLPEVQKYRSVKGFPERPPGWLNKTLSECIPARDPECLTPIGQKGGMQLTYFCGQDPRCRIFGSPWALQLAKYNIETQFSVVGVLEEDALSFRVLERYIPRFFTGVTKFFRGEENTNKKKPDISEEALALLKDNLKIDIDLYDFVKQRLHIQAKYLKIDNSSIDNKI